MVADGGYDPRQLAVFFAGLEAKHRRQSELMQFLSDHPNPGNRVAAVNDEVRNFPRRNYLEDETGRFHAMQELVRQIPAPAAPTAPREPDMEERREPSIP